MDKGIVDEVFFIRNLGYEVEIRKRGRTVSIGYGETKRAALANAIQYLKK